MHSELKKFQTESMKSTIEEKIEEQFGKIVSKFKILHQGWEGDGFGFITEKKNKKTLVLTNHSNPYAADVSELNLKISEYKTIIQETEKAIAFLA